MCVRINITAQRTFAQATLRGSEKAEKVVAWKRGCSAVLQKRRVGLVYTEIVSPTLMTSALGIHNEFLFHYVCVPFDRS